MSDFQIHAPEFSEFVDTQAAPEVIADGCVWTEGPVWLKDRLYFSDIPNKRMLSWHPRNGVDVVLANSEFTNGNTIGIDGRMVSCEHGGRRVVARNEPGNLDNVEVLAEKFENKRLNSPNDVVVKSDGSVWFTDPTYGIDSNNEGYAAPSEIGNNNVYRISPQGDISIVAGDFDKPNGIAFSHDEKLLYVTDSGAIRGPAYPGIDLTRPHHVRVFDVQGSSLANGRVFYETDVGVPDGLRVDSQGYVWCSSGDGIRCVSPDGKLIGQIMMPQSTANCCFGGESGTDLFITCSDKVYRVKTTRQSGSMLSL